jgi:hypothetical protein
MIDLSSALILLFVAMIFLKEWAYPISISL